MYFNTNSSESDTEAKMSELIAEANRRSVTQVSYENISGTFRIYQLKDSEENHYKRFE